MSEKKNSTSTPSWKNPSAATMQKCGLVPLPDDFEPTPQERSLLDIYETVHQYERQAKRLREENARKKLEASKAAFEQRNAPNKRRRLPNANAAGDAEHGESYREASDEETSAAKPRREKRMDQFSHQEYQEEAYGLPVGQNDAAGAETAASEEDALVDVAIRKKDKKNPDKPSLIAKLQAAATPPHDFSTSLELKRGKIMYPFDGSRDGFWTPPEGRVEHPTEGALEILLADFDLEAADHVAGPNTIAVKFKAPSDSKRFSLNIALADEHNDFDNILFHFNPRQRERGGQLVVNSKSEGTWGQATNIPLSQLPVIFGQSSCTLLIQISTEGFDVFIRKDGTENMEHCARLETTLPSGKSRLLLQMPASDDYGNPENWTVFRVWWGIRESLASPDLENVPGVNKFRAEHPRKLIIRNLPKIGSSVAEIDHLRAKLEREFRIYGDKNGVIRVTVFPNRTFAFVETETELKADLALKEMRDKFPYMNRARRSKHEALLEKREEAAAAAANH